MDLPEVRALTSLLFTDVGVSAPSDVEDLTNGLRSVSEKYGKESACKISDPDGRFSNPSCRLFPRNRLGRGVVVSATSDGSAGAEKSIDLAFEKLGQMMRTRRVSRKLGLTGAIQGLWILGRSWILKRRGFFVLIHESRTTGADDVEFGNSEFNVEIKSGSAIGSFVVSTRSRGKSKTVTCDDSVSASHEMVSTLVSHMAAGTR